MGTFSTLSGIYVRIMAVLTACKFLLWGLNISDTAKYNIGEKGTD